MQSFDIARRAVLTSVAALAATGAFAQECKNPETLVFSIIPTEETTQEVNLYAPLLKALKENTGKNIEFFMPTSYASVVEAMLSGWVQIGVHGPNSYVIAHEKDPTIEVFATYAKKAGHLQEEGPGYRAVLITRKGSDFENVDALKGGILGLVEPASTSGDLVPRVVFGKELGDGPLEDYFSKVVDRGLVTVDEFNVLWESPVIPQDPFTYRTDLCPDILDAIRKTFLTLDQNPDAKGFLDNVSSEKFVEVTDADYDIIRELEAEKK
jgi:phosphonate transport system substrate-binding protein